MQPFQGLIDATFSYDEDISFATGDLKTTSGIDLIKREVYKVMVTSPGDWKLYPDTGASPEEFIGQQNTRANAEKLENHLIQRLSTIVAPASISARVIPVARDAVIVYVDIDVGDLTIAHIPMNFSFINGFLYTDFDEENDTVIPSKNITSNTDDGYLKHPNPYWDRIRRQ